MEEMLKELQQLKGLQLDDNTEEASRDPGDEACERHGRVVARRRHPFVTANALLREQIRQSPNSIDGFLSR